jgi:hypothetical protein
VKKLKLASGAALPCGGTGGPAPPPAVVLGAAAAMAPPPPPPPRLEIILPPNPGTPLALNNNMSRGAAVGLAPTPIVRIALWDRAAYSGYGVLRNGTQPSSSFIDCDPCCFHIRVYDPAAQAAGLPYVTAQWGTRHVNGHAPAADDGPANLRLAAVAGQAGYFLSRAVMLVSDAVDRGTAHHGGHDPTDQRLRRVTIDDAHPLTSDVHATYAPHGGGGPITATATVFDHANGNPLSRRRMTVHLVDVLDAAAPAGNPTLTNGRFTSIKAKLQSIYGVCGVFVTVDQITIDPPGGTTGWPGAYAAQTDMNWTVADPAVELSTEGTLPSGLPMVTPSASQLALINVIRAGAPPLAAYAANDIYVFFIVGLYTGIHGGAYGPPLPAPGAAPPSTLGEPAGGEAFCDAQTDPLHATARGFAFIALNGGTDLSAIHEITHITTDDNNHADGHYELGASGAAVVEPALRNLMHRDPILEAGNAQDPKRLWDTAVVNNAWAAAFTVGTQITQIRASRFTRNY